VSMVEGPHFLIHENHRGSFYQITLECVTTFDSVTFSNAPNFRNTEHRTLTLSLTSLRKMRSLS